MAGTKKLLNDTEVLQIIENSEKNKNVSVSDWTLTEKGGKLTGFLGGYFCLKVKAIVVS